MEHQKLVQVSPAPSRMVAHTYISQALYRSEMREKAQQEKPFGDDILSVILDDPFLTKVLENGFPEGTLYLPVISFV